VILFFIDISVVISAYLLFSNTAFFVDKSNVLWLHWTGGMVGVRLIDFVVGAVFVPVFFYSTLLLRKERKKNKKA